MQELVEKRKTIEKKAILRDSRKNIGDQLMTFFNNIEPSVNQNWYLSFSNAGQIRKVPMCIQSKKKQIVVFDSDYATLEISCEKQNKESELKGRCCIKDISENTWEEMKIEVVSKKTLQIKPNGLYYRLPRWELSCTD